MYYEIVHFESKTKGFPVTIVYISFIYSVINQKKSLHRKQE